MKCLILGGAKSGKSELAEQRAAATNLPVIYVASAIKQNNDADMAARIHLHQQRRPNDWQLVEEPLALAELLNQYSDKQVCLLIDCLSLWLTNHLLADTSVDTEITKLCAALESFQGQVFLVSNEVGMGMLPMETLSRDFQDYSGQLHQALAKICQQVTLSVAGLPLEVKQP